MPQRRLKWHYRSKSEQLISFSNKNFYDGELVTFPSARADGKDVGVNFVHVADGVFDRVSKTNRKEAERIVDLVFEHFKNHPKRSLGVVAFSVSQQSLIDALLYAKRRQDPEFEPFFKSDLPEPFFVKNLETVQGDERDTIIFSFAYARDAAGRFLMNFGPVNRQGGQRRLNVAVTRAKINVKLVASVRHSDIDLARSQAVGTRLIREYLDYAENGAIALDRALHASDRFGAHDSDFEKEVGDFLRGHGYAVDSQVGCSAYRIDLALKRPDSSDYLLAIECDGASYHSAKSARDRDRLRQEVLENMGWKFYRIWSTDWFRNKQIEQNRLLEAAKLAVEQAPAPEPPRQETIQEEPDFERTVSDSVFKFPEYAMVDAKALAARLRHDVVAVTREIVRAESPIAEEWLLRRIVFMFDGRAKVTSVVKQKFESYMWNCQSHGIVRKDGFMYFRDKPVPLMRVPVPGTEPRDMRHIDLAELASGMKEVLAQNVTTEKQGLFRAIAQLLGFKHIRETMATRLESALKLLSDAIETNGEMVSLKKESV